jgi:hypothetical protein
MFTKTATRKAKLWRKDNKVEEKREVLYLDT